MRTCIASLAVAVLLVACSSPAAPVEPRVPAGGGTSRTETPSGGSSRGSAVGSGKASGAAADGVAPAEAIEGLVLEAARSLPDKLAPADDGVAEPSPAKLTVRNETDGSLDTRALGERLRAVFEGKGTFTSWVEGADDDGSGALPWIFFTRVRSRRERTDDRTVVTYDVEMHVREPTTGKEWTASARRAFESRDGRCYPAR